jgi:hypothetical protein
VNTQVTPAALDKGRKVQDCILPHDDGLPSGDQLIIDGWREIGARNGDQGVLLEKDLRSGKMNFQHRFMSVVAYQEIGDLGRITVHRAAGVDAPISETMPPHVLYCVEQTGFNDGESHTLSLVTANSGDQ